MNAWGKKIRKLDRDERGFTLIEMFSSLMILGMVATVLYSFMLMGITMYKRVTAETQLRNQANLVFGGIVEELRDAVYAQGVVEGGVVNPAKITIVKAKAGEKYVEEYEARFENDPLNANSQRFVTEGTPGVDGIHRKELKMSGESYDMSGTLTVVDDGQHDAVTVELRFKGQPADRTSAMEDSRLTIRRTIPLFRIE